MKLFDWTKPKIKQKMKERIASLLKGMSEGIYEKDEIMALALLSSIAGESIFLLGLPGVAKSLIARRLKFAFKDGTAFEYLMSRFSTPDEIFGPISISKLKNEDKYERQVQNYLPTATSVFLDEIWKSSPSISNALLTAVNERIFRNGEKEIKIVMKSLITASNELPLADSGLSALYDRFLIRYVVGGVRDRKLFNDMVCKNVSTVQDPVSTTIKITDKEYAQWSNEIDEVVVGDNILDIIHTIRGYLDAYNLKNQSKQIYVSDRRWKKIIRLLRTSALLNERSHVDLMDCFLIVHCIWNEPSEYETVFGFVRDAILRHGYKVSPDELQKADVLIKELNNKPARQTPVMPTIVVNVPPPPPAAQNGPANTWMWGGGGHHNPAPPVVEDTPPPPPPVVEPTNKEVADEKLKQVRYILNKLIDSINSYRSETLEAFKANLFVGEPFFKVLEKKLNEIQIQVQSIGTEADRIERRIQNEQ